LKKIFKLFSQVIIKTLLSHFSEYRRIKMFHFLLVDDNVMNVKILNLIIVDYMKENNIELGEYNIIKAQNGQEAVILAGDQTFDMIFLDIMMPVMNGFNALNIIRKMNLSKQPIIVMATALKDDITREKEKEKGANAYVVRPFGKKTITLILDHYLRKLIDDTFHHDDFFDFDDFGDDTHTIDNQDVVMDAFNNSHQKLSTEELLEEYDYLKDEIHMDLEEIDCLIMNNFSLEDDTLDLDCMVHNLQDFFGLFSSFLHQFSEFEELSKAIASVSELITNVDINSLDEENKEMLGIYMKAIIMDLLDWKEHVFIKHDAGDVFYANASLLNSYIEVKKLLQ